MTTHGAGDAQGESLERKPRAQLRDPLTYASVGEWFADYHGYVPIQMAQGLSKYIRRTGCTFPEAYARLRAGGAIIELDNPPTGDTRAVTTACDHGRG